MTPNVLYMFQDLVKHSSDTGCALSELEAAYGKMCKILQELNDSMHTAGLKGLPVSDRAQLEYLSDLVLVGCMLLQFRRSNFCSTPLDGVFS